MNHITTLWTDDRKAKVYRLWMEGKSAGEIAKLIVGPGFCPSRNAVIGVVHRGGLSGNEGRKSAAPPPPRAPQVRQTLADATRKATKPPKPVPAAALCFSTKANPGVRPPRHIKTAGPSLASAPKPWLERQNGECCWPVAGVGADILSCCAPATFEPVTGVFYCEPHRMARTSAQQSRVTNGNAYARSLRRYA